ncbi:MAG: family 20 glycosylhydrolase [Armatimonadota bacterium]|nr:MAG: family 20 glycosylhydrolase [Armatimonadota bacterium]
MQRYISSLLIAAAVTAAVAVAAPASALQNLFANPSFDVDEDADGLADGWIREIHTKEDAQGALAIDPTVRRDGAASQRIEHASDNAAWVRVSQQPIPARPGATYRFSAWLRGDCPVSIIVYEFRKSGLDYLSSTLFHETAPAEWEQRTATFSATPDADFFKVSLITAGKGTAWFDDASLVQIAEMPYLRVAHVATPPRIDGRLDDQAWHGAQAAADFMILGGQGELAPVATTAMAAFDDDALYVAFRCAEPDVSNLRLSASSIWGDDRVEVFLAREGTPGYTHLGVTPKGLKGQERVLDTRWNTSWYAPPSARPEMAEWQAAASVGESEWTAEMRVPFAALGGALRPAENWSANFCRTRLAGGEEEYSTWSYVPGDRFARLDRFGGLVLAMPPAGPPRMVRRDARWMPPLPIVIPRPVSLRWGEGLFRPGARTRIVIAHQSQRVGADMLAADLAGRFGLRARVIVSNRTPRRDAVQIRVAAAGAGNQPESYQLRVTPDLVTITGADDRGAFYGIQTLRQLLQADGAGQAFVRACEVLDRPSLPWRGWHRSSPSAADLDLYREVVDLLALLKFNTIVWEVDGNLRYASRPDIGPASAPTPKQLAALVAYAKERHFEVIPQLATFAHFGYVLGNPNYRHLAESQETTKGFRSLFNYCPSNPETYEVAFDLMDELIDVFQPSYFHIGHDEASFDDIGVCERCRDTDPWVLWARDINTLHAHLAERGIRTMMWGDQFLEEHNGDVPFYTARATDMVPKDIMICDWHYNANHDYDRTLGYFAEHGFETLGSPWFDLRNVYDFAGAVEQQRALGFLGTTWSGVRGAVERLPHISAAWMIGADNAWSTGRPPLEDIAYDPIPTFNGLLRLPQSRRGDRFEVVDIAPYCNESLAGSDRGEGWMGDGADYDLRALRAGVEWIGGCPFLILPHDSPADRSCVMLCDETERGKYYPNAVRAITVGRRADALMFLHTSAVPAQRMRHLYDRQGVNPTDVGHYIVRYADGGEERIPLVYQSTIADFNSQVGFVQARALWRGRTASGALATLGVLRWDNPRPEVEIESLDFVSAERQVRPALLAVTLAPAGK